MKLKEIQKCLSRWEQLIHNSKDNYKKLTLLIAEANYFKFKIQYTEKSKYIRAYPGIHKDKLHLFIIAEEYDTKAQKDHIEEHIQIAEVVCEQASAQLSDSIPQDEALRRIHNWSKASKAWIPKQAQSESGFFKCYLIPVEDLAPENKCASIAYFALKEESNALGFSADLILKDDDGKSVEAASSYYDTVYLVPPFSSKKEIYLLTAVENYVVD